jgi:23S rRNA pseudouridine1911/1915/1917 synthase
LFIGPHTLPEIIYEDSDLMVINKPPGLHSVNQVSSPESSLAAWLIKTNSSQAYVGKENEDGGLVQRLDNETSGLMIAARSQQNWEKLREMLLNGKIEKYYYCLVEGIFEEESVTIDNFIGSPYRSASKVRVYKLHPEKPHRTLPATTVFDLMQTNKELNFSLLKASAATARRHQVRAHAAFLNHPLVGDTLYGSMTLLPSDYPVSFFLQASSLKFMHPRTSKQMEFKLDAPKLN